METDAPVGVDEMPTSCDVPCMMDAHAVHASVSARLATSKWRFMKLREKWGHARDFEQPHDTVSL